MKYILKGSVFINGEAVKYNPDKIDTLELEENYVTSCQLVERGYLEKVEIPVEIPVGNTNTNSKK